MRLSTTAALLVFAAAPFAAQAQPAQTRSLGPWLLDCATDSMTDRPRCRMTHETPVDPASAGQSAMALEVVRRDSQLVPAVTARDLGLESAGRGLLGFTGTAQIRFPPAAMLEMPCRLDGRSVICAPKAEDTARAAAELAQATRALVRITGLGSGAEAAPKELRLDRTPEALAALRAGLPAEQGSEAEPGGFDLRDLFGRVQRFLFPE